jgi:glycosyltransferase involved in cell wall biosynthesis
VARKALIALTYYSPYLSGLTEYARLQVEGMAARGWECTVLAYRHADNLAREEWIGGVRVIRADVSLRAHKGVFSLDYARRFHELSRQVDIVHLHLPMLEAGWLAKRMVAGVKLSGTYHCDIVAGAQGGWVDRLAVQVVRWSASAAMARMGKIMVTSLDYAEGSDVLRPYLEKCVEVHAPDKAPAGMAPRLDAGVRTRVGFLGRFVEEKGIGYLLEAMQRVLKKRPDARLVLGGEAKSVAGGSQLERLRKGLAALGDAVEVLGKVPEEELFDFYRSLDVFVLPSVNSYEAFGMVQVEAMKAGVPVVASDMRGVRVPVQACGVGRLVAPRDEIGLAAAIVEMLENPGASAHEIAGRAWARFPSTSFLDQTEAVWA